MFNKKLLPLTAIVLFFNQSVFAHHSEAGEMISKTVPGMISSSIRPLENRVSGNEKNIEEIKKIVGKDSPSFKGVPLSPKTFYFFDKPLREPLEELNMNFVLGNPVYARVGHELQFRSRVLALLTPKKIAINGGNKSYVIAVYSNTTARLPADHTVALTITDKYQIVEVSDIDSNSKWLVDDYHDNSIWFLENIRMADGSSLPPENAFWAINVANVEGVEVVDKKIRRRSIYSLIIPAISSKPEENEFMVESMFTLSSDMEEDSLGKLEYSSKIRVVDPTLNNF